MASARTKRVSQRGLPALSDSDQRTLEILPVGWFTAEQLTPSLTRRRYRCERLTAKGILEARIVGIYPNIDTEYRRMAERPKLDHLDLPVLAYDAGCGIRIEAAEQKDGSTRWVAKDGESVLADDLRWEWQPMPSSRDEGFMERTRLDTAAAAYERLKTFRATARSAG